MPSDNDPKMTRFKCDVSYSADDGYRAQTGFASHPRNMAGCEPRVALIAAIDELARLAELFGIGVEAFTAVAAAQMRVREWRAQKEAA